MVLLVVVLLGSASANSSNTAAASRDANAKYHHLLFLLFLLFLSFQSVSQSVQSLWQRRRTSLNVAAYTLVPTTYALLCMPTYTLLVPIYMVWLSICVFV